MGDPSKFTPLQLSTQPEPVPAPIRWYVLIRDMEEWSAQTGDGLAGVWGLVRRERYDDARQRMDDLIAERGTSVRLTSRP